MHIGAADRASAEFTYPSMYTDLYRNMFSNIINIYVLICVNMYIYIYIYASKYVSMCTHIHRSCAAAVRELKMCLVEQEL